MAVTNEYSDRSLTEFELNICPLFLVENVHTVHHKIHMLWSHLQQGIPPHYGPYMVLICVQQYTIKPHDYSRPCKIMTSFVQKE